MEFCRPEVQHISSCADCYEMKYTKPNEWRSLACSKPHLVLWVHLNMLKECSDREKQFESPSKMRNIYWPAKLISVGDDFLNLVFFHGPRMVEIPTPQCFIHSSEVPLSTAVTQKSLDIADAYKVRPLKCVVYELNCDIFLKFIQELDLYKQSIRQKFGHFEDKQFKNIPFNPKRLDKYIRGMFPGYSNGSLNNSGINDEADSTDESNEFDAFVVNDDSDDSDWSKSSETTDGSSKTTESDTSEESSDVECIVVPRKRQRLHEEIEIGSNTISNPTLNSNINSSNNIASNTNQNYNPPECGATIENPAIRYSSTEETTPVHFSSIGETTPIHISSSEETTSIHFSSAEETTSISQTTVRMKHRKKISKKREHSSQLNIQAFCQELEKVEKSSAENQAKNRDLFNRMMTHLNTLTDQRNEEAAAAKSKIETLEQEKETLRKELQVSRAKTTELESKRKQDLGQAAKLKMEHDQKVFELENEITQLTLAKQDLEKKLQASQIKLDAGRTYLLSIIGQHKAELQLEEQRTSVAIEKVAEVEKMMKEMEQNEEHLRNELVIMNKLMVEAETNHKNEMESKQKGASDAMDMLKTEYNHKITELENQLEKKVNDEAKLSQQYKHIVNNLRMKTEAKKCTGCDEFKIELFCSSLCQDFW